MRTRVVQSSSMSVRAGSLVLLALLSVPAARAEGPLWQVVSGERTLLLGGTIHVLSPADYPLPESFERAYAASAQVVLETDIHRLRSPAFQRSLLAELVYTDERDLSRVLDPETYRQLDEHLSSRGIPIAGMVKFKPGMLSMMLTVIELQRLGQMGTGVDEFYADRALGDGKALAYLESAEQQLAVLSRLGEGRESALIAYTLRDIGGLGALLDDLKAAWRRGDLAALEALALEPLRRDFPGIHADLVTERNEAWISRIEAMLETVEVELVLVGALHLAGEEGILSRLEALGYVVRPFSR